MTRLGLKAIVFYILLVCAFFAAPYLNLFFLLIAFCSAVAVMSLWWAWRNVSGITGELLDAPPAPAGASQLARASLGCGHRPRFDLNIELDIGGKWHLLHRGVELEPGEEAQRIDLTLPALPRGIHPVAGARVRSQYPLGMVQASVRIGHPEAVVVFPAPADLVAYRDRASTTGIGLGGAGTAEMGPSGLREYRHGDELRRIHWKASARRTELVVRDLEGDAAHGVEVVLDLRVADEPLEEALSLISALAIECRTNKELFTLHAQDHRGTYGKGHESFDTLFAYLAGVQPLPTTGRPPPPVSPGILRLPLRAGAAAAGRTGPVGEEVRC